MTITVQAGITLAALQAELAKEGQWLPIDVALPEQATLGGAIALNKSGPRRYGYGTLRDYVIGISFVTDDGVEVKAGGRVVKNVAGYDLMKLQIGAAGTLGVVTQVTLKVKPKPEVSAAVAFGCAAESLGSVLDLVHASKSRPMAVELLNPAAWRSGSLPAIVRPLDDRGRLRGKDRDREVATGDAAGRTEIGPNSRPHRNTRRRRPLVRNHRAASPPRIANDCQNQRLAESGGGSSDTNDGPIRPLRMR